MKNFKNLSLIYVAIAFFASSCVASKYQMAQMGVLPSEGLDWEIEESQHFQELKRTYGQGITYERAKINYLLGHTAASPFSFDRNGYVYDGETTAKHLRKKYRQRIKTIKTAQNFIDNVASISTASNNPYLAIPGDGLAYPTGDILNHELRRLETYMDNLLGAN